MKFFEPKFSFSKQSGVLRDASMISFLHLSCYRRLALAVCAFFVITISASAVEFKGKLKDFLKSDRPFQLVKKQNAALIGNSGAYLAATEAERRMDFKNASFYFNQALRFDSKNVAILENCFLAYLRSGKFEDALRLTDAVAERIPYSSLPHLLKGLKALKADDFRSALSFFEQAQKKQQTGGGSDLMLALVKGWAHVGAGQPKNAFETLRTFDQEALTSYRNFFQGLMAEVNKQEKQALAFLRAAYLEEPDTFRVVDAYARLVSRLETPKKALEIYKKWRKESFQSVFIAEQAAVLNAGRALPPLIETSQQGVSEVFYSFGVIEGGRDFEASTLIFQMALYLNPKNDLIKIALAESLEAMRQFDEARKIFLEISPHSPYYDEAVLTVARIIRTEDDIDGAISFLEGSLPKFRKVNDARVFDMLASFYRAKEKYAKSIAIYDKALASLKKVAPEDWFLLFGRGVSYEREGQWEKAERDFLKVLSLINKHPETLRKRYNLAQVLNYLAYSWIERKLNVKRAFEMLKRATALSPEDGAIVDSLGWAYYKLGRYDEAVRTLDKAVDMKPADPFINDHLGDAYWRVGRVTEAFFQWRHARELFTDHKETERVAQKIKRGAPLDATAISGQKATKEK